VAAAGRAGIELKHVCTVRLEEIGEILLVCMMLFFNEVFAVLYITIFFFKIRLGQKTAF